MFLGKYTTTLDENNRFSTPSRFRSRLIEGAYIVQGFDKNLWVLTASAFEKIYRIISVQNITDPLARLLLRMILSTTHEVMVDADGRIAIPSELKNFANIDKTVVVIGQGDYFEIWEPTLWEKQESQFSDTGANAGRFSSLAIVTR